jgi:hypothetical protein
LRGSLIYHISRQRLLSTSLQSFTRDILITLNEHRTAIFDP